ncbi:hypothetical protein JOC54_002024 [Alkalihalobacillus xiaoxiensis]|uniref:Uncharacterized protein n=1 Tax=Shouchella xiaoxiensis TaxID=766895 RepID=A0ABS2STB0_9BACI|nr:hypothetical protein [Shouchella xiaoxiensis]MBM7838765.1 hypothetical protein [Shouchella xiaoxiensis]
MVLKFGLLIGTVIIIALSQKKNWCGDRKLSFVFFTMLTIGFLYGSAYILEIQIPSVANGLTKLIKNIRGIS